MSYRREKVEMCTRHVVAGRGFLCKDYKDVSASGRGDFRKLPNTYKN